MTDEDLIKRLRGRALFCRDRGEIKSPELHEEAADRIEQLVNENYQLIASLELCNFAWDQAFHQRDEAEAKLAKAVKALRSYVSKEKGVWNTADAVLAELGKEV